MGCLYKTFQELHSAIQVTVNKCDRLKFRYRFTCVNFLVNITTCVNFPTVNNFTCVNSQQLTNTATLFMLTLHT